MNTLLIVEDDEVFSSTLARRMTNKGFQCVTAANVSDALLLCHQHRPDYVLLDMKLENESGLALIKPVRNLLPRAKIVLLTGFASIATAVDAIKLGADDYLSKPIDTQTLLAALAGKKVDAVSEPKCEPLDTLSAERAEWEHIQQVLKFNDGNVSATARQLSMHRRTLQRKLQKKPAL